MPKEDPNMSIGPEMVDFLERQLKSSKPKMTLELGTGAGVATKVLAKYSTKVVTVDHDAEWTKHAKLKLTLDVTSDQKYDNIIFITGYDSVPTFDEEYNFVFVDGPPDIAGGRKNTLLRYWDRIAEGATIVFDDTNREKINKFVTEIANEKKCIRMFVNTGRGIGIIIK